jgi:GxxExxY protein
MRRESPSWLNHITGQVVDASVKIHKSLGPGLLESVYERCLLHELGLRGLCARRQQPFPVIYDGVRMDIGFRADLLVENDVILEIKSVEATAPVHRQQLLTYLRVTNLRLGLLLNFGAKTMREGITRIVNDFDE